MEQTGVQVEDLPDPEQVSPQLQAAVDAGLARVDALVAADPDTVYGDAVEVVALDSPLEVALELCHQSLEYVPDTVRRRAFEAEHADTIRAAAVVTAEQEAVAHKAQQRTAKAAATRAATLAAEAAVASAAIKSSTCPNCFTVRAASGVCGCD